MKALRSDAPRSRRSWSVGRFLAARGSRCWTGRELRLSQGIDGVILAVPDTAIEATAQAVVDAVGSTALIHCSGATPLAALAAANMRLSGTRCARSAGGTLNVSIVL